MRVRLFITTLLLASLAGLTAAFALSVENGNVAGSFANVADPDEQQPALVGSAGGSAPSRDAAMDRFANDAQAPQITRPSYATGLQNGPASLTFGNVGGFSGSR